jgi:hypothetical protein
MADPQDLITTTFATEVIAAGGGSVSTAQNTILATLVTDASKLICRERRITPIEV